MLEELIKQIVNTLRYCQRLNKLSDFGKRLILTSEAGLLVRILDWISIETYKY
jgi:hypothetical protein